MRFLAALASLFLLAGCVAYYPAPYYAGTGYGEGAPTPSCIYRIADRTADGASVPAGYVCAVAPGEMQLASASGCTFVSSYLRVDGSYVAGHTRCPSDLSDLLAPKANASTPYTAPASSPFGTSERAPCVTGYCGPVHVRGYYRKDGTYVRPHTRSRPRR